MTSKFTPSMFESIKSALQKNSQSTSSYKDILKTEVGNTYVVRLLPNCKKPDQTFFHYYSVGWTSFATGQYITYLSPSTFGERDPVLEAKYRILRNASEDEETKAKAESIKRTEKWLVNAYVVKDAKTPENEGKIMIVRYGKQLQKIIMDAIEGEGSEDYGPRIFDLTSNGCNFIIKVEKQGDYPTYVSSKFSLPKAIDGIDDDKVDSIYNNAIDLSSVLPVKSFDEIKDLLNEHFYCVDGSEDKESSSVVATPPAKQPTTRTVTEVEDSVSNIDEDKVNELLKDLDSLT
jgi:hypothetical protein